jgi:hypothetical protein
MSVTANDRRILREAAKRVAEIAALPVQAERREMWYRHNRLEGVRPMVLVFPEGAWRELLPEDQMRCEDPVLRGWESRLKSAIYHHQNHHDDFVIEPHFRVPLAIRDTGWGIEARHRPSSTETGAWGFDPVIVEPSDLRKLRFPQVTHDEAASNRAFELAQETFGDILRVRQKGDASASFHLMGLFCEWRGLEQVMVDMVDRPQWLHEAMSLLEEGHRRRNQQLEALGLLSLNNEDDYVCSGGVGYSKELPAQDYDGSHVRTKDMWGFAEAQEMAQVSPKMHWEFILQYEKRLLEPFGLNTYGCCEDLTDKLDFVLQIPNLRRVSISPWADVARCAEKLNGTCILSWKPHPSMLVGDFSPDRVRAYLRHAMEASRGCAIEMILKDTHTCQHHPERFTIWTDIAQEVAAEAGGS